MKKKAILICIAAIILSFFVIRGCYNMYFTSTDFIFENVELEKIDWDVISTQYDKLEKAGYELIDEDEEGVYFEKRCALSGNDKSSIQIWIAKKSGYIDDFISKNLSERNGIKYDAHTRFYFTGTNFLGFGKQKEFMSNINLTKSNVYIYMTQLTEEFRSKTLNQELQLLCELN